MTTVSECLYVSSPVLSPVPQKEAEAEAKGLSDTLLTLVGRGPNPPDSNWLHMDRTNPKKPEEREPMGKLCLSIEVIGKKKKKLSFSLSRFQNVGLF